MSLKISQKTETKNLVSTLVLKVFIAGLFMYSIPSFGQNLVPNYSFEDYSSCPFAFSLLWMAEPWETADPYNSSEIHNSCEGSGMDGEICATCVPANTFGFQYPLTGEGYAGFWCYNYLNRFVPNMTETLQVPLDTPMEAGEVYQVSFYVSLSDNSTHAIDQISAHFSVNEVVTGFEITLEPHIQSPEGIYLSDKEDWMLIEGTYVAEGGEQWMTIANFDSYLETNDLLVNGGIFEASYYYVDDVRVMPEPEPVILGETTMCFGDSVTLTAINADQWAWSTVFDPELIISTDSVITVSPAQSTLYFMDDGESVASILITVNPLPEIDLGEDQILCSGSEYLIDPELGEGTYSWQDGAEAETYTAVTTGLYWLEYNNGICANSDSIEVQFNEQINFSLGNDTLICKESFLVLNVPPPYEDYNIEWSDGSQNSFITVEEEGVYSLTIDDNICSGSDEIIVSTMGCTSILEIPNIFTPNDTFGNDLLIPIKSENILALESRIFDRWGNLVYSSSKLDIGWDGKNQEGLEVAEGTYFYIINYKDQLEEAFELSGDITLIR